MRTDDATIIEGTQEGTQGYIYKNGDIGYVDYSYNGTNMQKGIQWIWYIYEFS